MIDKGLQDAPMNSVALIRLERMSRNMPVRKLHMEFAPSKLGRIYLAWGEDGLGTYHGMWGIGIGDQAVARSLEFKKDTSVDSIRDALILDALGFAQMAYDRHMHDEGWWSSGRA
ncbi:MAG: hypothetical protein C4576_23025 [Desulfobacteraceae bacterium]|nr:MAG: hypothetical protein C4576_23025 [Desulfobacteraceae bacterium]